jgi:hypothetical protein
MHSLHSLVLVLLASTAEAAPRRYADLSLQQVERQLRLLSAHSELLQVADAHAMFGLSPVSWVSGWILWCALSRNSSDLTGLNCWNAARSDLLAADRAGDGPQDARP